MRIKYRLLHTRKSFSAFSETMKLITRAKEMLDHHRLYAVRGFDSTDLVPLYSNKQR